jgi:hypothetical protein
MSTPFKVGSAGVVCAAIALLLLQPGTVQAHPQLVGRWTAVAPPNSNMSYTFDPGEYIGDGVWRGTFTIYWANNPISCGSYELRMLRGTYGVLSVRDGPNHGSVGVGDVDVGIGAMNLKGLTYRPQPLPPR